MIRNAVPQTSAEETVLVRRSPCELQIYRAENVCVRIFTIDSYIVYATITSVAPSSPWIDATVSDIEIIIILF